MLRLLILACLTLCSLTVDYSFSQFLLIPDSTGDRVSAFSAFDGSVIDLDFIPDDGSFSTPINAIDSGRGTIFVSDQVADAVFEYSLSGNLIGTVADSSNGLDNIRGIAMLGNELLITNSGGTLDNTIQSYNLNTNSISTWANVNDPFDILIRNNDALITNIADENIESYDLNGNFLNTFHDSDGVNGIDFPEQMFETANGDIIVGGFSAPAGIYVYDQLGNEINYFDVGSGVRGVFELGNGDILWTDGAGVHSLNTATGASTLITAGSYRFIEQIGVIPEPSTTSIVILIAAGMVARRRR